MSAAEGPALCRLIRLFGSVAMIHPKGWCLIGFPKRPGDFREFGALAPPPIETWTGHWCDLERSTTGSLRSDEPQAGGLVLHSSLAIDTLATTLALRLLVARNGSVSERLWRLCQPSPNQSACEHSLANWLVELPLPIWEIVRNEVLRCS